MLYMKKNNKMLPLTGSTLYADTPIGTIQAFTGITAPQGYLIFDGREVSRTEYADLWKFANDNNQVGAGKFYGDGDGSTTFTLADLRETSLKGIGLTSRTVGAHIDADGLELGEFIDDRVLKHEHYVTNKIGDYSYSIPNAQTGSGYSELDFSTQKPTGNNTMLAKDLYSGTSGPTNEVKAVGVNWIVKAKHVALPIDIMDSISEEYATKDAISYSTNEILTGGTWIDGKPIYRIVLDSTTAISSGAVSIDVASLHIESLVRMDGFFRVTGSPRYAKFPLQMYVHSSGNGMYLTMDEGNTKLLGNIDYSATQGYQIILEYTKA